MAKYEIMFIVKTTMEEGKIKSTIESMKKIITDYIDDNDNVSLLNKVSKLVTHGFIGPINFISMFLLFVILYKIGFNLIVDIIVSSLIVVFINYFVYKDHFYLIL